MTRFFVTADGAPVRLESFISEHVRAEPEPPSGSVEVSEAEFELAAKRWVESRNESREAAKAAADKITAALIEECESVFEPRQVRLLQKLGVIPGVVK